MGSEGALSGFVSDSAGDTANNTHRGEQPPAQTVALWGSPGYPITLPPHRRMQASSMWMKKDEEC